MNTQPTSGHESGICHWWAQRLSSLALIPLSLWFVFSVLALTGVGHAGFTAWVGDPGNMLMLVLFVVTVFYHAGQGLQVVIEDYIHSETALRASLIAARAFVYVGGASCLLSIFNIAFGR